MFNRQKLRDLAPQEVKTALDAHEILLIDVREPAEFAAERIHGALNFPLSTFAPALPAAGDRLVVFQCGSGKRSAMAIERCQKAGHAIDAHLAGGIMAWKAAGLPTITLDTTTGELRDPR
ncbi:MAG TPA: rhodanese-like domain-containing protein [Phenylobacterium sp.]|uniref:rhodanese-like domain-containing protein n=1 Tax=Phenylobacterium sp. TaxID=1871053 RepID=UPI002F93F5B9